MPWWLKLILATGLAAIVVRLTSAAVRNESFPSIAVVRWGVGLILALAVIAVTTYYYYLRVPPDEDNNDEPVPTSFVIR